MSFDEKTYLHDYPLPFHTLETTDPMLTPVHFPGDAGGYHKKPALWCHDHTIFAYRLHAGQLY